MINFIFIGGTFRGFSLLKELINKGHIPDYAVILKEDDHETAKFSSEMVNLVGQIGIPYALKRKIDDFDRKIIEHKIRDFAIVCGWRTIIPFELNEFFKFGIVAAHDSLLPKYRGFAPINWAIINGEMQTGVTLFVINEGEADSGDIVGQKTVRIENNDYAFNIYEKITLATIELCNEFISNYVYGEIKKIQQDEAEASYTCKRIPEDGKIDWTKDSFLVFNLIRALAPPYPGAFCMFNGKKYTIIEAELGEDNQKKYVTFIPGRIISIGNQSIEVMCGKGTIKIIKWQDDIAEVIEAPNEVVKSITATLK